MACRRPSPFSVLLADDCRISPPCPQKTANQPPTLVSQPVDLNLQASNSSLNACSARTAAVASEERRAALHASSWTHRASPLCNPPPRPGFVVQLLGPMLPNRSPPVVVRCRVYRLRFGLQEPTPAARGHVSCEMCCRTTTAPRVRNCFFALPNHPAQPGLGTSSKQLVDN